MIILIVMASVAAGCSIAYRLSDDSYSLWGVSCLITCILLSMAINASKFRKLFGEQTA